MIDSLYIENILKLRTFGLFYSPKDREMAVLMTDAIRRCANIEVLYYKVANKYILPSEIPKYLEKYVFCYDYINNITLESLLKHKKPTTLRKYIGLFQASSSIPENLQTNIEIINYPKNLAHRANLSEIITKYGKS